MRIIIGLHQKVLIKVIRGIYYCNNDLLIRVTIGHLEKDESNMDAAIRETEEEAGIKVKDLNIDHNFEKVLTVLK